jgi:hypothetical protein
LSNKKDLGIAYPQCCGRTLRSNTYVPYDTPYGTIVLKQLPSHPSVSMNSHVRRIPLSYFEKGAPAS